jgi:hypothetical protein
MMTPLVMKQMLPLTQEQKTMIEESKKRIDDIFT